MSDLLKLAERCVAATGPDRELDAEIAAQRCGGSVDVEGRYWKPGVRGFCIAARYTSSVDAALGLVPDGCMVSNIGQKDNARWWAEVRRGYITSYDKAFPVLDAATPALALTAAALRARDSRHSPDRAETPKSGSGLPSGGGAEGNRPNTGAEPRTA